MPAHNGGDSKKTAWDNQEEGGDDVKSVLVTSVKSGTLGKLPVLSRRKVGMTSSPHGPYGWGFTRATMTGTKGREPARGS